MMLEKTEVRLGGNVRFLQSPGIACFTAVGGRALDVCLGEAQKAAKKASARKEVPSGRC